MLGQTCEVVPEVSEVTLVILEREKRRCWEGRCVVLVGVSWENEVIGHVVQENREGFTAQPGVQLHSLAWAFCFLQSKPSFPRGVG